MGVPCPEPTPALEVAALRRAIVDYVRQYRRDHGSAPPVVLVGRRFRLRHRQLMALFPEGYRLGVLAAAPPPAVH